MSDVIAPAGFTSSEAAVVAHLEAGVARGDFTAWAFAGDRRAVSCFFADEHAQAGFHVSPHPLFDLASLTKPLLLNALTRHLLSDEALFAEPLSALLRGTASPAAAFLKEHLARADARLTVADFLDHATGVEPWFWFGRCRWFFPEGESVSPGLFESGGAREAREDTLRRASLTLVRRGLHNVSGLPCAQRYSDVDSFLLSMALPDLQGRREFQGWRTELSELNARLGTGYLHASLSPDKTRQCLPFYPYASSDHFEPSRQEELSGRFGPVHDTNAQILATLLPGEGLVSGHAGLFGSVTDVVRSLRALAADQGRLMRVADSLRRQGAGGKRFQVGLDTPDGPQSTAGIPAEGDARYFGHLGYTGTSFWFRLLGDRPSGSHVLLTNRVAARRSLNLHTVPRVLVATELGPDGEAGAHQVLLWERGSLRPCAWRDALELTLEASKTHDLLWDDHHVRPPPNINALRRDVGSLLWDRK